MTSIPAPKPRVSPFVLPLGMRRRNAYGTAPIQPDLLPFNLLRSHLYPGNEEAVAEGIREFRENINRGEPTPQLPQRMAFQWHKPSSDGAGPGRDPRASAASLAAAIATQGRVATFVNEITMTPRDERDAMLRAQVQQQLFPSHVEPGDYEPTDPARQTAQTTMPTTAEMLEAYGMAQEIVAENGVERRQTFIGRAMSEVSAQSRKVLGMLRSHAGG